ncbi:hypothetical protein TNCV_3910441 [Trichonephila clavipes]|nr:hypothetical protein TNCV_3910441 [Trichonephila clavipes]
MRCKANTSAIGDGPRNFEPRSFDEDSTEPGTFSKLPHHVQWRNVHLLKPHRCQRRLHLARDEVSDWLDAQRSTLTALV